MTTFQESSTLKFRMNFVSLLQVLVALITQNSTRHIHGHCGNDKCKISV